MGPVPRSGARRIAIMTAFFWSLIPTIALIIGFAEARRDKTGLGFFGMLTFGLGAYVTCLIVGIAIAVVAVRPDASLGRAIGWGTLGPFIAWAAVAIAVLLVYLMITLWSRG
jgi:hypothetical protein